MKKLCYILLFFGLVLSFIGLSLKGLKTNASQNLWQRVEIQKTIDNIGGRNYIQIIQIPNTSNLIENDDSIYSVFRVKENDNYSTYLGAKRSGVDSFNLYGYLGTNYNKSIDASQFIGIYLYGYNNIMYARFYRLQYNSSTRTLEVIDRINASDIDLGGTINRELIFNGITFGSVWIGSTGPLQDSTFLGLVNDYIAPNYGNTFDAISAESYNRGYGEGYDQGYADGQSGESAVTSVWTLISGIFTTLGAIFSIELFPHIPLGVFFLVPLFFGIVGLILWIWRRN